MSRFCLIILITSNNSFIECFGSDGKESACYARNRGSVPMSGRSPREGSGNPLQYSCLEISWTEESNGLSPWGRKESDTTEQLTPFCLPNPILSALYVSTHLSPYHFEGGIIIIVS